ncbi:hypothetical protein K239x_37330 [Planctomycetes bacterium K23_9]|uniref:Uncharacterized protein n=1 Tax=Stieleria marina TaxID=1930275 RepID=A0A517NX78_9BACT|nr:hypothetical protein K239x_37330 [Planctomycetes bacterium K23_9]
MTRHRACSFLFPRTDDEFGGVVVSRIQYKSSCFDRMFDFGIVRGRFRCERDNAANGNQRSGSAAHRGAREMKTGPTRILSGN